MKKKFAANNIIYYFSRIERFNMSKKGMNIFESQILYEISRISVQYIMLFNEECGISGDSHNMLFNRCAQIKAYQL